MHDELPKPADQHSAYYRRDNSQMLQEEITMNSTTAVKDPVCGMDIETATSAGRTEHKGQTYYFCGSNCKEKFDLNPEQYLGKSAGTPKSGHGCCS
jgi:Cu+-exporting ATPase